MDNLKLRPERTHRPQFLWRKRIRRHNPELIPFNRADICNQSFRAVTGGFDDAHPGFQIATALDLLNHALGHEVLVGTGEVGGLGLELDVGMVFGTRRRRSTTDVLPMTWRALATGGGAVILLILNRYVE